MRRVWPLVALTSLMLGCEPAVEALAADHPIIGAWTVTMTDGSCSETYRFHADGTTMITSGAEVAEVRSRLSASPDQQRFYRWDHTITKHNGRQDCAGNVMKVGDSGTWYVQFDRTGDRLILCQRPSTAACFGPLQRVAR